MRGNEVFQHGQSFAEVGRNRRFNDLARGLSHQSTHAGELADLLLRSASAGIRHHVNWVDDAFLVVLLHVTKHFISNLFCDRRPDFDDLVIALTIGNCTVKILLLNAYRLLLAVADKNLLVVRNDHVIDTN